MHEPHLTLGEGLMYGILFLMMIGITFFLITVINLIVYTKKRIFYGWLLFFIALPPAVILAVEAWC